MRDSIEMAALIQWCLSACHLTEGPLGGTLGGGRRGQIRAYPIMVTAAKNAFKFQDDFFL